MAKKVVVTSPPPIVVPKRPVRAAVTMLGDRKMGGEFFLDNATPLHEGPETLLELINNNSRTFVPFHTERGTLLLNRLAIRIVEFDSPEVVAAFVQPDNPFIHDLRIVLRTETQELSMQGFCHTGELHPQSRRPADLLNTPDAFLLFYSTGTLILVNKAGISYASIE